MEENRLEIPNPIKSFYLSVAVLQEIHGMGVLIEDGRRNRRNPGIPAASIDEELKMVKGDEDSGSGVNTIWGRGTSVSLFFSSRRT
jgi:hypothetical protein